MCADTTTPGPSTVKLATLSVAVALVVAALLWPSLGAVLTWDEVDYLDAARLGTWANMVDEGSLTPTQFFGFVRAKLNHSSGSDAVPAGYDEELDPLRLRHYHPPLVTLLLSVVSGFDQERVVRSVQLFGGFSLVAVMLFSYRSLSPSPTPAGLLLVLVLAVWMSQTLFATLNFHGWAAVWIAATCTLLSAWLRGGGARIGVTLSVCLALLMLTLETGLLVYPLCLLCLAIWRPAGPGGARGAFPWLPVAAGFAVGFVILVSVWPGAVLKVSLVKIPALYLYRIKLGAEYSSVPGRAWSLMSRLLPLLVPLPAACLGLLLFDKEGSRRWGPYCVVGGLYAVALARFALSTTYILPAVGSLACVAGYAADRCSRGYRAVLVGLTLMTVALSWPAPYDRNLERDKRAEFREMSARLTGREAYVDGAHIYRHYLGPTFSITSITVESDGLYVRRRGAYRKLRSEELASKVVVVQRDRRHFLDGPACRDLLDDRPYHDLETVRVYEVADTRGAAESPPESSSAAPRRVRSP